MQTRYLFPFLLITTIMLCFWIPEIAHPEAPGHWIHPPTLESFLFFGTYKQDNLLYLVMRSSRITLYISFLSLLVSLGTGFLLIFLDFHPYTRPVFQRLFPVLIYVPRLFLLILLASFLKLQESSRLSMGLSQYLILLFGLTGGVFLASQSSGHVTELKEKLFVQFAQSLRVGIGHIFFLHILRNCTSLPISTVKQMRDNVLFLSTLTFIGVVQLQPMDLGSLIFEYSRSPEAFSKWWILFFPCAILCWLILLFDYLGEQLATAMEKKPVTTKM